MNLSVERAKVLSESYLNNIMKVKVKSLSRVRLFATRWTVAYQAPPSMGFSRQDYWSGLPFSFSRGSSRPRDRTRVSCVAGRCFNLWATRCAENVVQPLALSISRTFSLSQTETLCGLRSHFPPSLQSLVTSILLAEFFYSMYFI